MNTRLSRRAVPYLVLLVLILLLIASTASAPGSTLDSAAILDRIRTYRLQGRTMQALYQIEALAAQTGWTPDLQREAGDIWAEMGDLSTAVAYWEAALRVEPDNASRISQLAETALQLQRWPQAVDLLRQLTEHAPDNTWAHDRLGLLLAASDPQQAVIHLNAAEKTPVVSQLLALLTGEDQTQIPLRVGLILTGHELWPYAEIAFERAAVDSQPAVALAYLGFVRDQQGKSGAAFITQAIQSAPQNPQVLWLQGLHLRGVGDYQASMKALAQAVSLDPQNPAYIAELGTAFRLIGDLPQAEYWLRAAVAVSGDAPEFRELLERFYSEEVSSFTAEGLGFLGDQAVERPDDPDLKAGYGWALYVSGDTEAGLEQIEAALKLDSTNPRALFYKARTLIETGQTAEAVPLLRQVAALDSDFAEEAARVLQNLGLTR